MSRVCVGYEGRTPIWRDEGPAVVAHFIGTYDVRPANRVGEMLPTIRGPLVQSQGDRARAERNRDRNREYNRAWRAAHR